MVMKTTNLFSAGEKVRFKVIAEQFTDTTPSAPGMTEGDGAVADRKEGKIPYIVFVSIILMIVMKHMKR